MNYNVKQLLKCSSLRELIHPHASPYLTPQNHMQTALGARLNQKRSQSEIQILTF